MKKLYLVQTVDIGNNHTFIGFFDCLHAATEAVIENHPEIPGINDLELKEYPSAFGMQFNTEVEYDEETGEYLYVYGYIMYLTYN